MAAYMVATTTPTVDPPVPVNPCTVSTEKCIEKYFPENPRLAVAVFKAESGLETHQIGYNCRYGNRITSCKPLDHDKAVSLDYGLTQINQQNYPGNKDDLLDPETNLKIARKIYDKQGWNAWFAYKDNKYVKYLD